MLRNAGGAHWQSFNKIIQGGKNMPRRGGVPKRDVLPDPIYNSKVVTKLINQVMYDGKKGIAQRIVYDAFDIIKEKTGREAMEVFNQALENIMPMVETRPAV